MAAAEPHGLQQELSRGRGQPRGCSEPALPPSPRAVTILGEQLQLPLLPQEGRSILIPPGPCISQSRTTTEHRAQSQGLLWHPGRGAPRGSARGLEPALAGSRCSWALPVPSLCPRLWLHPALGHLSPAEPKLQHLAPLPLPWHREGTRNPPQGPLTFQGHRGSSPQPWAPEPRVSSTLPFPCPQHGFGDQISSPTSPAEPEKPLPGAVPARPGCPQPPLGACFGLPWQPLPKARCQRLPRSRLCPQPTLLLFIPGSSRGRDDAGGPACWRLDE